MRTIGGFLAIRNNFDLDYCIEQAVKSLLPVCDQVAVLDIESSDGTWEFLQQWSLSEPKLKLARGQWTNPVRDSTWWPTVLNQAREHLDTDWAITLDADELLHENSYAIVEHAKEHGDTVMCYRWNFWRDQKHLIPKGCCCGTDVIRIGPRTAFFPSDYPDPRAEELMRIATWPLHPPNIMHYGFLRRRDAFFRKARVVQEIWAGSYDTRLEAAEKFDGPWGAMPGITGWEDKIVEYSGTHPKLIIPWLAERGYGEVINT